MSLFLAAVRGAIVLLHIVSHTFIFTADYTQALPMLDFIRRPDGSHSDPLTLTPSELTYAAVVAMGFGTVAAAFILALIGVGTTRGAAALSIVYHGLFAGHLLIHKDSWARFMHPDAPSGINELFFLASHGVFTLLAAILLILPAPAPGTVDRRKAQ